MRLRYSRDELLADHDYHRPHAVAGYRLHGGFDAQGQYVSPRMLHRGPAIEAWRGALKARGGSLIDASVGLLRNGSGMTPDQQALLLEHGLGETLWNGLTVTGVIEAKGRALCDVEAPDFQDIVVENLEETATGHLNRGLLYAHGLDEGGDAAAGIGGHDAMWFAVRDTLFGKNAYPEPAVPESLSRPETGRRMPSLPPVFESWILLLMNVLMIEVRAEAYFAFCTAVMRDPRNFSDRRQAALEAASLVERIRQDEASHVGYLQLFISELRAATFKTADGQRPGASLIDPIWADMAHWHGVTNAAFQREQTRAEIKTLAARRPDGAAIEAKFDALSRSLAA